MEEKEYIAIIEAQKQTIEKLTKELEETKEKLKDATDKDNTISYEHDGIPIELLGLSNRTCNKLLRSGICSAEDVFRLYPTREKLLSIPNFGKKGLEELIAALEPCGFDVSQYVCRTTDNSKEFEG